MLVPTPRLWWLLAAGIPVAAVGAQAGVPLLGVVYDAAVLGGALLTAAIAPNRKSIKITRSFDAVLSVRVPNTIRLKAENLGNDPISFRFRDEPPPTSTASTQEFTFSLRPGSAAERSYSLTPAFRGTDFFRGGTVRISCPLGLVMRQESLPLSEAIRVYPNVQAVREFSLLRQQGRLREIGIRRSRIRGLGTEFESLREYTEGDDFRKIDWSATARGGKLIVRQYETERNQSVLICIDAGRHMLGEVDGVTKLDHALDACLMLAQAASFAGDHVGLLVYADRVIRYIPPQRGKLQLGRIIDALHDVVVLPVASDAASAFAYLSTRWKRRSLVAVFTDTSDADSASDLATALGPLIRRHLIFRAQINDPRLEEALTAPLVGPKELYTRSAGLLLESGRKEASALLQVAKIASIESEPQNLAARLISYYYDAKEHARI